MNTLLTLTLALLSVKLADMIVITLYITGFLCLLNIALAIFFRKQSRGEILAYYGAFSVELIIFVFALLLHIGVVTSVPYHLPPGLQFNRAEIGAAIAIGLGLFPAAYWHRASWSELNARMAQDAKVLKERDGGVRIRKNVPGEWMN